jgi:DNA-binding NtrC family response regulator
MYGWSSEKGFVACHSNQKFDETQRPNIRWYIHRTLLLRRRKRADMAEGLDATDELRALQVILRCPHCHVPLQLTDLLPEHLRVLTQGQDGTAADKLKAIEKYVISRVVGETQNLKRAARLLGIGRTTLYRKRKQYGIGGTQSAPPNTDTGT